MDEYLFSFIIENINKDKELKEFYDKYYYEYSEIPYEDYIKELCIDNPEFFKSEFDEHRKKILKAYINTRSRLNKKAVVIGRLINFPLASESKKTTLKSIVDNELKLLLIENIKEFFEVNSKITERPLSLDGMYTTKEKMTLYDADSTLDINDRKAYMSEEKYKRQIGIVQPLFFANPTTEVIFVKKGEKSYLKSKSMDTKDQKIMDFLIEEYKQVMYYPDQVLIYPIHQISKLIYNRKGKQYLDLTRDRLAKIGNLGQIVFNDSIINKKDAQGKLIDPKDNYEIVSFFDIQFFTNELGVRFCKILMSRSIEYDLKTSNTIKLYKHKIEQIKNDFTAIFVNFIQSQRINSLISDEDEAIVPYKVIKTGIRLPNARSKVKNLKVIEESLEELVNMNFLIDSYEVKNTYIKLHFIPFGYIELKELKLDSKAKELEI